MPEDFSHVQPGQPVGINAATWNVMLDSAAAFKREGGNADQVNPFSRSPAKVRVRNDSGATRNILDVLIVENTPAITPTDNAEGFKTDQVLVGSAVGSADTAKPFVVLAQPLVAGAVGWAHCAGMFVARVNVGSSGHKFCNVKTSDSTQLDSAHDGQARILYKQGTGASQLCLIQYPYLPVGVTTSPTTLGSSSEGSETAASDSWTRSSSGAPLDVWQVCRVVYDHAGSKKLFSFVRKFSYDSLGLLIAVSAETRIEVDAAESC